MWLLSEYLGKAETYVYEKFPFCMRKRVSEWKINCRDKITKRLNDGLQKAVNEWTGAAVP